jgi:hypothetical protein
MPRPFRRCSWSYLVGLRSFIYKTAWVHPLAVPMLEHVSVTTAGESASNPEAQNPAEGLSQFLGKVLDQLSLTSWMPAGMLVGVGALLLKLHAQHNFDVAAAVSSLATNALGTSIVLVVAVILAAVVTQAFSFGTIRFFEGYWGSSRLARVLLRWRSGTWSRRRTRLRERVKAQRAAAFKEACEQMGDRKKPIPKEWIEVLQDDFERRKGETRRGYSEEIVAKARALTWETFAVPASLHALDRAERRLREFPSNHRLLPTYLGNVLRANEDRLKNDGFELEGLVMRRYDLIPRRLMIQHDQFRDRLDMYCTLVPVFSILAIAAFGLLARRADHFVVAGCTATALVVLAWVSYRAAIASARGYAVALTEIARRPESSSTGSAS